MIKTQHGCTSIKGTESEIMADFSCVVQALYKGLRENYSEDETNARIAYAYERALHDKDKFRAEVEKSEEKAKKAFKAIEALADLLEAIGIDLDEEGDEEGDEEDGSAE